MKIIDAHNHPDWLDHSFDRFIANMDKYGISQTWILNWQTASHEYATFYNEITPGGLIASSGGGPIPFECCLSYVERAPERFVLGFAPDPRLPDACARLKAAHSIYGARVCGEMKCRMMYDNPDAVRLFRLAGELKMPVVLHMQYDRQPTHREKWGEWFGGSIETLEHILQLCPDTNFLGHAPGFWVHISEDNHCLNDDYPDKTSPVLPGGKIPELLRRYSNLYCDISAGSGFLALSRDPVHAVKFFVEFQDRILYARDSFENIHQEFINSLQLPQAILEKVYHGNAEKLLHE